MNETEASDTSVVVDTTATGSDGRIGRFSHAQLQAMVGKRGRKPPEFYELFPKFDAAAPARTTTGRRPIRKAARGVHKISSAVLGDHTIDELLAMIGSKGKKPAAFAILRSVAQAFVDAQAVDLPKPAKAPAAKRIVAEKIVAKVVEKIVTHDTLAAVLAATPKKIRTLVLSLLGDAVKAAKSKKAPAKRGRNAGATTKVAKAQGRKRGRPAGTAGKADQAAPIAGDKPRRGRPPKQKTTDGASSIAKVSAKRGRKPTIVAADPGSAAAVATIVHVEHDDAVTSPLTEAPAADVSGATDAGATVLNTL